MTEPANTIPVRDVHGWQRVPADRTTLNGLEVLVSREAYIDDVPVGELRRIGRGFGLEDKADTDTVPVNLFQMDLVAVLGRVRAPVPAAAPTYSPIGADATDEVAGGSREVRALTLLRTRDLAPPADDNIADAVTRLEEQIRAQL
jgi:hypothetical protein